MSFSREEFERIWNFQNLHGEPYENRMKRSQNGKQATVFYTLTTDEPLQESRRWWSNDCLNTKHLNGYKRIQMCAFFRFAVSLCEAPSVPSFVV